MSPRSLSNRQQRGIVLIVALIILTIVSLLAALSLRNASSNESISGAVRTTNLATQSAEIALRYCEDLTLNPSSTPSFLIVDASASPAWQTLDHWDKPWTHLFTVPLAAVNQSDLRATFSRAPECIVEKLRTEVDPPPPATPMTTTFVVTARGFGPEVPAVTGSDRRPVGAEVWLQTTIELGSSGSSGTGGGTGGEPGGGGDHDGGN